MKQATLPMMELEAIAVTRFIFGIGVALVLGHCLTNRSRRCLGWTFLALGALSTPPLIYDIYANRARD